MLQRFKIENLFFVESAEINFSQSLNIISGETGAGKSVLLDILVNLMGLKQSSIPVMFGKDSGYAEISLNLEGFLDSERLNNIKDEIKSFNILSLTPKQVLIGKNFSSSGKSSYLINGQKAAAKDIKILCQQLLEIYGQHDFSNLFSNIGNIEIIDNYADNSEIAKNLAQHYRKINDLKKEITEILRIKEQLEREEDYIRFVVNELEQLEAYENEEEQLSSLRLQIKESERLTKAINDIEEEITANELSAHIFKAQKQLEKIKEYLSEDKLALVKKLDTHLENASIEINEAEELISELQNIKFGEGKSLHDVEDRLYKLREIARKYKINANEIHLFLDLQKQKLQQINFSADNLTSLEAELKKSEIEYLKIAEKLSITRLTAAEKITKKVNKELPDLNLATANFRIYHSRKNDYTANGYDDMKFEVSINPNQPFSELGKTASGGELSRVMLALKLALAEKNQSNTIIFDEIDTGISGYTAEMMSKRIKELSRNLQVIAITHQPQLAAKADNHIFVTKELVNNMSQTKIRNLTPQESEEESARMISGTEVTNEAVAAIKKLKG